MSTQHIRPADTLFFAASTLPLLRVLLQAPGSEVLSCGTSMQSAANTSESFVSHRQESGNAALITPFPSQRRYLFALFPVAHPELHRLGATPNDPQGLPRAISGG